MKKQIYKNIAVAAHPQLPEAIKEATLVASYLEERDIHTICTTLDDEELSSEIKTGKFDLLIALGGDGTMLRAGHICAPFGVAILGINLGRFGFLMEIRQNQWQDYLSNVFSGNYWFENRMMLNAQLKRQGEIIGSWEVLNEVVVGRGQFVRPVHLITHVNGRYLTTYVADAVIAATATGSTAYALAAGGPILPPELKNILLVAVAPHLSIDRAIVLADSSSLYIEVQTEHDALLCIDGQPPETLHTGDGVDVKASEHNARFMRFQDPGYFYRNLTPHMSQNPSTGKLR